MQPFPHVYETTATATPAGEVTLQSPGVPDLTTALPAEFGGKGDRWSPETLLSGAIADCFAMTFRGIAASTKLPWTALTCDVQATLNRIDRVTRFTDINVLAYVRIPNEADAERARHALHRAEETCLITNSLTATRRLEAHVEVEIPVGQRDEVVAGR